ncbi:MAG TPA: SMP-30/gluconolactonase/LRE family protein [Sphingomonadaceae bacterium]|nr:SMP-30/gluconolactonase/LRE family protein [Sphingomonadaceae bacterium]
MRLYVHCCRIGWIAAFAAASVAVGAAGLPPAERLGGDPLKVATCGGFLEGPNIDAEGKIWAVDYYTGNVLTVANGACAIIGATGGAANGARFGPDGRLYIADAKRGLLTLDPASGVVAVWIDQVEGEPLVGANDLVFDGAGNLYVTVRGNSTYLDPVGQVVMVPHGSRAAKTLVRGLRFPNGIAVDAAGTRLFVGLFSEKTILAINLDPRSHAPQLSYVFAHTRGGIGPDGMMLDQKGRLYWADFGGGTITVADDAAHILGQIRLPDDAGACVTNMAWHDGAIYVTEADRGEIWKIALDMPG